MVLDTVVFEGGDGSSMEKAVIIKTNDKCRGVESEYEWLKKMHPDWRPIGQTLLPDNGPGKSYDVLECVTPDGETRKVYFDITDFFGKESADPAAHGRVPGTLQPDKNKEGEMADNKKEVLRIIGDRFKEEHPFLRRSVGMVGFAKVVELVKEIDPQTIATEFLPMIDKLLGKMKSAKCHSCYAKLCVYAHRMCLEKLPEQAKHYDLLYVTAVAGIRNARDFRAEVEHYLRLN